MPILHTFKRAETAQRSHLLGASAAPVILGLSPWQTPMGLWLTMQEQRDVDSIAKKRGRYLEAGLLQWTADECKAVEVEPGIPLDEPGIAGPEAWMQFHPDGALQLRSGEWRIAEIKTSRLAADWGDGADDMPLHYLAQVQFQLACCPTIDAVQVGAYLPVPDKLKLYCIQSDKAFQRRMIDVMGEWVYKHIVLNQAPDVDGSAASTEYLRKQFPQELAPLRACLADSADAQLVREFADVKQQLKSLHALEDVLANQLRAACGDGAGLHVKGIGRVTLKHVAEAADIEKSRAAHPDVWKSIPRTTRRDLRFWASRDA